MKNSKWYLLGIGLVGVAAGIVLIGSVSAVSNWAGTTTFCGEFCHSMDLVNAAYKKGIHYKTASGVTAGCTDCHLLNKSNEHNGPIDYTMMMIDKARAGTSSFIGEVLGTMSTPEKQMNMRQELSHVVHEQMKARNYSTCRGCHDFTRMNDPKKVFVTQLHQKLEAGSHKPVDCLACHPNAGHDYRVSAITQKRS